MALSREGDTFYLKNPEFGGAGALDMSFTVPSDQIFRDRLGRYGVLSGDTLTYLTLPGVSPTDTGAQEAYLQSIGVDTSQIGETAEDFGLFTREGLLTEQKIGEDTAFWQQFGLAPGGGEISRTGGELAPGAVPLAQQAITQEEAIAQGLAPALSPERQAQLEAANQTSQPSTFQAAGFRDTTSPPPGATYIADPAELSG